MPEYHDRLTFRETDLTRKETAARAPAMAAQVQNAVSALKPGMRFSAVDLIPRIPAEFLEQNYLSLNSALASVSVCLRKMDTERMIGAVPGGEYVVQKQAVTAAAEESKEPNRTRVACLHLRAGLLEGWSYAQILNDAPVPLRGMYGGVAGLKRACDTIVNRIVGMSDAEFRRFYESLDDPDATDSPLKGLRA